MRMRKLLLLLTLLVAALTTRAQQGTADDPFELVKGSNTIPAAAGTYYYTGSFYGSNMGLMLAQFRCDSEMTGSFFADTSMPTTDEAYSSLGLSAINFPFNLVAKNVVMMPTFYVRIIKTADTDYDGSFTFSEATPGCSESYTIPLNNVSSYSTADNPYQFSLPSDMTEIYYSVGVPFDGDSRTLAVKGDISYDGTYYYGDKITIYPQHESSKAKSGRGWQSFDGTGYNTLIVKVEPNRYSGPDAISDGLSLYFAQPGSDYVTAIEATEGSNTFPRTGSLYYVYQPSLFGGSVMVSGGARFPYDVVRDRGYDRTTFGIENVIQGAENEYRGEGMFGPTYMILNGTAGESFTLTEMETPKGATSNAPIEIAQDTTLFAGGISYPNLVWIKYTAPETGYLTVTSNAKAGHDMAYALCGLWGYPGGEMTEFSFKTTDEEEEEHMAYIYVRQDENCYIRCYLGTTSDTDRGITFKLEKSKPCDKWQQAYTLPYGHTVELGTVSESTPAWVKVESTGDNLEIVCSADVTATVYFGDEIADDTTPVETFSFTTADGCKEYADEDDTTISGMKKTITTDKKGTYYIRLTSTYGSRARVSLLDNVASAIRDINAAPATSVNTALYNLSGQRVSADYKGIVIQNGKKLLNR